MNYVVPVYSIAKPYKAAAVLLTFSAKQRIGEQLEWLPEHLASLSFEGLLTHRSGLNDYFAWPEHRVVVANSEHP